MATVRTLNLPRQDGILLTTTCQPVNPTQCDLSWITWVVLTDQLLQRSISNFGGLTARLRLVWLLMLLSLVLALALLNVGHKKVTTYVSTFTSALLASLPQRLHSISGLM